MVSQSYIILLKIPIVVFIENFGIEKMVLMYFLNFIHSSFFGVSLQS